MKIPTRKESPEMLKQRPKANTKPRKPAKREADRELIARLMAEGKSYREVEALTGLSSATIASDVKEVKRLWRERSADSMHDHLATETAKLNHVERRMYAELENMTDPEKRVATYAQIAKLVYRRADLRGLKNLADINQAASELEESYREMRQRYSHAVKMTLPQDAEAYKRFEEHFRNYDPAEQEAKALAEMESTE